MNYELKKSGMTNYRWVICGMLFLATAINYLDRQVLSLTWKDFISPEFHWTDTDYGNITAVFSLVYAVANLCSGKFMDWIGTRKGYVWAIAIWSFGACMHAFCGWATMATLDLGSAEELFRATGSVALAVSTVSTWFFIASRVVLGIGEAGNFPAAVKITAEYFPMKDRAYATSIFNSGSTIGALVAPLSIPLLARYFKNAGVGNGWEMAFLIIGGLGFLWLACWLFVYRKPSENRHVNEQELAYIMQDAESKNVRETADSSSKEESGASILKLLTFRQTWGIVLTRFIYDGVWWFFLFWTPAYLSDVYGLASDDSMAILLIFVLYAITMLSIYGGKLPTIIVNRTGLVPYEARLKAMFVFSLFPLLTLLAQPLGSYSYWYPVLIIGIAGAAHQSWSANNYSVVSDLFPQKAIGTVTGLGGMAAGIGCFIVNKVSGQLFDYADQTQMVILNFQGKPAGYFLIFCYCAVAYILAWAVQKTLVPKYKRVEL